MSATRTSDVAFGTGDAAVDAYVVDPAGAPRAGVLFLHWVGEHRSDRTQFLSEARSLAALGVRSVLPAGRLPWGPDPVDAATDAANIEIEQLRLRAALDGLAAGLPEGAPIALVGHDFGAMHGLLLASRNPRRLKAAVFIAATPRWGDWFLPFWQIADDRIEYLRAMRPLDPIERIREVGPASVLFQFAERDFYIAPMTAREFVRAAPDGSGFELYDTGHDMRLTGIRDARLRFLGRMFDVDLGAGSEEGGPSGL